jgi:hypothetical protein
VGHPQLILLYGDLQDTTLTLPLSRTLAALGGVLYCGAGCTALYGDPGAAGLRFVLHETEQLHSCGVEDALVICQLGAAFPQTLGFAERLFVLAASPAPPRAEGMVWLGCACGEESTLALSSLREESAVVELRRALPLPGGDALEPGEFPLRLPAPLEGYPLLCYCGLALLFGNGKI